MDFSEYIEIPGGEYSIGLEEEEIGLIPDRTLDFHKVKRRYLLFSAPRRTVTVPSVMVAARPVTGGEFSRFVMETGYVTESEREGWGWVWEGVWKKRDGVSYLSPYGGESDEIYAVGADRFPAIQISWNDAAAYCAWAGERSGVPLRLPAEAEWEVYAGLIGVPSAFTILGEEAADRVRTGMSSMGDGPYPPGQVWEWTADWFDRYPGGGFNREFGATYKVLRGGSLMSEAIQRSREYRFRRCPTARSPFYGFRTAFTR